MCSYYLSGINTKNLEKQQIRVNNMDLIITVFLLLAYVRRQTENLHNQTEVVLYQTNPNSTLTLTIP